MSTATLIFRIGLFVAFLLLFDVYAYQSFKTVFRNTPAVKWVYWGVSLAVLIYLVYTVLQLDRNDGPGLQFQILAGLMILFLVPKMIISGLMFMEDVARILVGSARKLGGSSEDFLPDRRAFVSKTALVLAAVPFAGVLHGIWKGRYNYRVIRQTLTFADLPEAFDGFRITQISDIHSGSFNNYDKIKAGVELINEQESDVLFFTGDLVNNRSDEMEPWIDLFSKLEAPQGMFSIFGNHDYGDYTQWPSEKAKRENLEYLAEIERKLGFDLLRNENRVLERNGEKIHLVGVENWGQGFAQYGDLEKALQGVPEKDFTILLSHDPSHFDAQVKNNPNHIHLTLSGHTHGMQFGIEIPGFVRWSPVSLRYPKWAGLYEELGRYLYVNRGFGYLAFPGRVGIWPEITVLELRKG